MNHHADKPAPAVNPWGLTEVEARTMDAFIEAGSHKGVARKINRSVKTVEAHCARVKRKMSSRNKIDFLLQWDRWRRGQGAA